MNIVFDSTTIIQSKTGLVTGVVYFDFDQNQQFPIKGWNDFVVVITNWWLAAIREIAEGKSETKFRFMDGPYWITATPKRDSMVLLHCVEDRVGTDVFIDVMVETATLSNRLYHLANEVLQACDEADIESSDLETLRGYLQK